MQVQNQVRPKWFWPVFLSAQSRFVVLPFPFQLLFFLVPFVLFSRFVVLPFPFQLLIFLVPFVLFSRFVVLPFSFSFSSFSFRSFCFPVSLSFHFRSSSSSFSSRSFCFPVSLSFHFRFTLPPSPNRLCSFVVSLSSYFLFVELLSSFFFSRFSIKSIQGLGFVWRLVLLRVFRSLLIGFYEYLVVCFSPIAFLAKDIPRRCGVDFKLYCRTPLVVIA